MNQKPFIYVALPVLNESENLPRLMDCLTRQDYSDFKVVACVNNYEHWWDDPVKQEWCIDNQKSIEYLKKVTNPEVILIDKSSKGKGWTEKKGGVGIARKTTMDFIVRQAKKHDLIASMDADTWYPVHYLTAVHDQFKTNGSLYGLALPYYHKLAKNETDRLILRYEIYMRYYLLNMLRIKNPYAFTALGSAMAFPVWAYEKVGGLTPVKSGEDFYFLQKLAKSGKIGLWADTVAYPSSRFSERVTFGTGPALLKGSLGSWENYPLYEFSSFDKIKDTFDLFPGLFENDMETPMDSFLKSIFKTNDIWGKIRENYKDRQNFIRACKVKADALRILQFLRFEKQRQKRSDESVIVEYFEHFWNDRLPVKIRKELEHLDFKNQSFQGLNTIRDFLYKQENVLRKSFYAGVFP
ncbi:MAG: hypothetical protein GXO86_13030 [Chlorobi bacterium]|nr:hypothetical protein [Chlorobiota bacterium]